MSATTAVEDSFTFVGGLFTEGGYFLTPKNSWKSGDNVIPNIDGSLVRRKGIDYEDVYNTITLSPNSQATLFGYAYVMEKWSNVGGNGNMDFFVVQIGPTIHFYTALGGTVSNRKKTFSINLASYQAAGNTDTVGAYPIEIADCYGNLIITSQSTDPIVVTYLSATDNISVRRLTLKIRDFTGLYMSTAITAENTEAGWGALYPAAIYNLYNQGWNTSQINGYKTAYGGNLPANTKSWIYGKDASDNFVATTLNKQEFGTSPAPRGRFVLDAFNQDRATVAGIPGITSVSASVAGYQDNRITTGNPVGSTNYNIYTNYNSYRPASCAFFAGRAWYSGVKEGVQSTWVMYSSVATDTSLLEACYQSNDPTAEVVSDLVDSDGGVIVIPEAGTIMALRTSGNALVVFATNGIWTITGGDQGFKATSYIVDKISDVGCFSTKSVVSVEDTLLYWAITGVYAVKVDNTGLGTVSNISDKQIKTLYSAIPTANKLFADGVYDTTTKVVTWLYTSGTLATETDSKRYFKDKALCFDTRLQAWYTYTIATSDTSPVIVGANITSEALDANQTFDVYVDADNVLVDADQATVVQTIVSGGLPQMKYATLMPNGSNYDFTFSDLYNVRTDNTRFKDWYTALTSNAVEVGAYAIPGYTMGNVGPARSKTVGYVTMFMRRTETNIGINGLDDNQSGVLLQTRWDFTDDAGANKWSTEQQVYRQLRPMFLTGPTTINDGYPLVVTKNKIRGRGKAVQLKLSAEAGKDMQLVGWTMTFVGNTNV